MLKPPVTNSLPHPFSLAEVLCIPRKGYLHYLMAQFITGLRTSEITTRKEAHHG